MRLSARGRCSFVFAMLLGSCLELEPPGRAEPFELLGIDPTDDVQPVQAVNLAFSESVGSVFEHSVEVYGSDPTPVALRVLRVEDPRILRLAPQGQWPSDQFLNVVLTEELADVFGRTVVPVSGLGFRTQAAPSAPTQSILRAPLPEWPAPANQAWVLVASVEALAEQSAVYLEASDGHRVSIAVQQRSDFELFGALPPYEGPCAPLCPQTPYRVMIEAGQRVVHVEGRVVTSTVVDTRAPVVTATRTVILGDQLFVDVDCDEPVVALGYVVSERGDRFPLALPDRFAPQVRVQTGTSLPAGVPLVAVLTLIDGANNTREVTVGPVRLPARPHVVIQEIVATPLRDWSDSEGGGTPFDNIPGRGTVNDNDEWVELVNRSAEAVDLHVAGLELTAVDGSPAVTPLAGAPQLFFGSGGTLRRWGSGEALVVRVRGSMSQRELVLELRWGTVLVDRVVISARPSSHHPGGPPPDAIHEALARGVDGIWRWCVPSPGDPLLTHACRAR